MTLAQLREIVRNVRIQNTLLYGESIVVHGMTIEQLLAILLLAQSQLCELEGRANLHNTNPS